MKGGSAAHAGVFLLTGSAVVAGCVLVTDLGTGGYHLAEVDACTPSPDASCAPPASRFCASTTDCLPGQICCLTLTITASLTAVPVFACQIGPCNTAQGAQVCSGDDDCEGGACTPYTCMIPNAPAQEIGVCGTLSSSLTACSQGP